MWESIFLITISFIQLDILGSTLSGYILLIKFVEEKRKGICEIFINFFTSNEIEIHLSESSTI